jgi:hypothetical protein
MSLADITSLGNLIGRGTTASTTAPVAAPSTLPTTAPTSDMGLSEKLAAAQASRPVVEPTKLDKPSLDYANIRPEMLIDPEAAGWVKQGEARYIFRPPFDNSDPYIPGTGTGSLTQDWFANVRWPGPEGSYTDASGNIWVRKGTA